jgi:hypothetical protein
MVRLSAAVAVLFVLYFPLAAWVDHSYVNLVPKGKIVVQLVKPFETHVYANISYQEVLKRLAQWADDEKADPQQSPIMIYEDGVPLGPGHSTFGAISKEGAGRFAHWRMGVVFSASDNSDPNTNGRNYWAVLPDEHAGHHN